MRRVLSSFSLLQGVYLLAFCLVAGSLQAAAPFRSATVTKTENKVLLGERKADRSVTRPAVAHDIMQSNNFLASESDSRAELQYPDGTLVRVGQNTVFTFDSDSRTLSLDKGSLLFHMPKNQGGGTIRTPSLTAAITGTTGKVSDNFIMIVEGEVKLIPSGLIVHGGEFAVRNADGSISIKPFDKARVLEGKLVYFNGLMPGFPEIPLGTAETVQLPPDLREIEILTRTQGAPSTMNRFSPIETHQEKPKEDKPSSTPPPATPAPQQTRTSTDTGSCTSGSCTKGSCCSTLGA